MQPARQQLEPERELVPAAPEAAPAAPGPELNSPAAALAEVRRITAPGGRVAFTAGEDSQSEPANRVWATALTDAGLALESAKELTGTASALRRLYDLTATHAADLRADLGSTATDQLLHEAEIVGPALDNLTWVLYVARPST